MSTPEFSRLVPVARIGRAPATHRIEADAGERAALARRLGLVALDRLAAEIRLVAQSGGGVRVEGVVEAALVQRCIVTLEPVHATVCERFSLVLRPGLDEAEADRLTFEDETDTVFEPLHGDAIDIGEMAAQQLSLGMEPYPRVAGAVLEVEPDSESPADTHRPFEVLGPRGRKS
jgi:hypothetical protein